MLPHSSINSQTLCGGTASLHWGQIFNAGGTRKSWLLRIPCADGDLRRFGTATNVLSRSQSETVDLGGKALLSESEQAFQERLPGRNLFSRQAIRLRGQSSRRTAHDRLTWESDRLGSDTTVPSIPVTTVTIGITSNRRYQQKEGRGEGSTPPGSHPLAQWFGFHQGRRSASFRSQTIVEGSPGGLPIQRG